MWCDMTPGAVLTPKNGRLFDTNCFAQIIEHHSFDNVEEDYECCPNATEEDVFQYV